MPPTVGQWVRKYFGWEYNTQKNTVRHGGVGKYFGEDDNTAVAALIRKRKSDQRADCAAFCLFWHQGSGPFQWIIQIIFIHLQFTTNTRTKSLSAVFRNSKLCLWVLLFKIVHIEALLKASLFCFLFWFWLASLLCFCCCYHCFGDCQLCCYYCCYCCYYYCYVDFFVWYSSTRAECCVTGPVAGNPFPPQ